MYQAEVHKELRNIAKEENKIPRNSPISEGRCQCSISGPFESALRVTAGQVHGEIVDKVRFIKAN